MTTTIGRIAGTGIAVRVEGSDQQVLVAATDLGRALVHLLAAGREVRTEGDYLVLVHDREVDERLKELADVSAALRYAHPSFVQLPLRLGGDG